VRIGGCEASDGANCPSAVEAILLGKARSRVDPTAETGSTVLAATLAVAACLSVGRFTIGRFLMPRGVRTLFLGLVCACNTHTKTERQQTGRIAGRRRGLAFIVFVTVGYMNFAENGKTRRSYRIFAVISLESTAKQLPAARFHFFAEASAIASFSASTRACREFSKS
jgi:hypothetical protein